MKDINLLPEDIKSTSGYTPSKSSSGATAKAIAIVIFILFFIGATILAPKLYIKTLESELSKVEKAIEDPVYDPVKKVRADLDSVNNTIKVKSDIMDTIDKKSYPINEVLVAVTSVVPRGCYINSMEYSGTNLKIYGKADNSIAIAELVSKIHRLDFIQITRDISVDNSNTFSLEMDVGRKEGN